MKTFIKPAAVAVMLLLAGSSFAQTNHPPVHHHKHHKYHKHHKKARHIKHHIGKHHTPPPSH